LNNDYITFGAPSISSDEISETISTLNSGWIGTGPKTAKFEELFREYVGSPTSIALNSCTAALQLSLASLNLESGDEIITTPMTFCATVNAILHAGARPVFADVCPLTHNIDPTEIEKRITSRTRAILPVHFAGRPCDMDKITQIAEGHDLHIIEDCAHAVETTFRGRHAGTFGEFGCFSFYATKNVAIGEGGMVVSNNVERLERLKRLALHGMTSNAWRRYSDSGFAHYDVVELGYKCNMTDLHASLGIHQLKRVEANWEIRKKQWDAYISAFSELPIGIPTPPDDETRHAFHLFTLEIDPSVCRLNRDQFISALHEEKIGTGVHYRSIPEHPFYQKALSIRPDDYPNAYLFGRNTLSIPIGPRLTDTHLDRIIGSVTRRDRSEFCVSIAG